MENVLPVILAAVAEATGVHVKSILGDRQTSSVVRARRVAYYLARELTGIPLLSLGEAFGRKPGTVLKGAKQAETRMRRDRDLRVLVVTLRRRIEPQIAEGVSRDANLWFDAEEQAR